MRKNNIRSIVLIVFGLLISLSFIICFNLIKKEKDLKIVEATVVSINEDTDGAKGQNIDIVYSVDGVGYYYGLNYSKKVEVDDVINVYYHEKDPNKIQINKTSYYIFAFPAFGFVLCIIGILDYLVNSKKKRKKSNKIKVVSEEYIIKEQNEKYIVLKPKDFYTLNNSILFEFSNKKLKEIKAKDIKKVEEYLSLNDEIETVILYTEKQKLLIKNNGKDFENNVYLVLAKVKEIKKGFKEEIIYNEK